MTSIDNEDIKTRLVANPRLDYKEIFSPIVNPATILLVLSIVGMQGWPLRQMDAVNVFFHGDLV